MNEKTNQKREIHDARHLSEETLKALRLFRLYHPKRFYTDQMLLEEDEVRKGIPEAEFADYVRYSTLIQEGHNVLL